MRIGRTTAALSILLCGFPYASAQEPSCDCHLVQCNDNIKPVVSFCTSTPVQAVVKEGDSVENQTVFDRDLDVRAAMWVRTDEFQLVEDTIGVQAEMDENGDGWILMEFNFSLGNRRQINAGTCAGFNTPLYQQVMVVVGADGRQTDGA